MLGRRFAQKREIYEFKSKAIFTEKIVMLVTFIWAASGLLLFFYSDRGTFGDMFGAINSLFSGLAFALLIYSAWMQKEELILQRKELELTRNELNGQKQELITQNSINLLQSFETTFFEMVKLYHQIVKDTKVENGGVNYEGKDGFYTLKALLLIQYERYMKNPSRQTIEKDNVIHVYREFFFAYQQKLGHYFRTIYHILKFVDKQTIIDKNFYIGLFRSQLSSNELALLFYNGNSDFGKDKFMPLAKKYNLFKNMDKSQLISPYHDDLFA